MVKCRSCGYEELSKDGIIKGKQRYKCKRCKRLTRNNEQRYKYSISTRLRVLKGLGELIAKATVSKKLENVEILEMDGFLRINTNLY